MVASSTGAIAWATGPAASSINSVNACWISVPLIFSIETSAPGALPAAQSVEESKVSDRKCHQLDLDSRELVAEARILGERLAVLALRGGERFQSLQLALGRADAGGVHPLVAEQVLGDGPAFALVVDAVLDRDRHLVEEHFVDFVAAVHQDQRSNRDPRRAHVDQQERNAVLLAFRCRIGANQAKDPIGDSAPSSSRSSDHSRRNGRRAARRRSAAKPGPSPSQAPNSPGTRHRRPGRCAAGSAASARRCRTRSEPARTSRARTESAAGRRRSRTPPRRYSAARRSSRYRPIRAARPARSSPWSARMRCQPSRSSRSGGHSATTLSRSGAGRCSRNQLADLVAERAFVS